MPALDAQALLALAGLLAVLVLWVSAWRGQERWRRRLKRRREASRVDPPPPKTDHGGPWG